MSNEPEWKSLSLRALVDSAIWSSVMECTAFCGWTERAREGLVKAVQANVKWALDQHLPETDPESGAK